MFLLHFINENIVNTHNKHMHSMKKLRNGKILQYHLEDSSLIHIYLVAIVSDEKSTQMIKGSYTLTTQHVNITKCRKHIVNKVKSHNTLYYHSMTVTKYVIELEVL